MACSGQLLSFSSSVIARASLCWLGFVPLRSETQSSFRTSIAASSRALTEANRTVQAPTRFGTRVQPDFLHPEAVRLHELRSDGRRWQRRSLRGLHSVARRSMSGFKSVDDTSATHPDGVQAILQRVRSTIRKALPGARKRSATDPHLQTARRLRGVFRGWKQHYSLYPAPAASSRHSERTSHRTRSTRARSASALPAVPRGVDRAHREFLAKEAAERARRSQRSRRSRR